MLKTVYLPTASADGKSRLTSSREVQSALFAIRYQTSSGPAKFPCPLAATNSFFRLMMRKADRPFDYLSYFAKCEVASKFFAQCELLVRILCLRINRGSVRATVHSAGETVWLMTCGVTALACSFARRGHFLGSPASRMLGTELNHNQSYMMLPSPICSGRLELRGGSGGIHSEVISVFAEERC
jgi:hypothetical protein